MFGPRLSTVFANRWRTLWWAGSILLLAYCSVPDPDDKAVDKPKPAHVDPWAKDSKPD